MVRHAVVVLGILSLAATAHAQPGNTPPAGPPPPASYVPPPTYAPPPATRTVRYGTKVAAVDALAAGLVLVGTIVLVGSIINEVDDGEDARDGAAVGAVLMVAGTGVYAFGPAFVHHKQGNPSSAWKSIALRLGLPMLGGVLGAAIDQGSRDTCYDEYGYEYDCGGDGDGEAASGLVGLGILAAMVIDWGLLSKVEVKQAPPAYYPYATALSGGGGAFGLAGSF